MSLIEHLFYEIDGRNECYDLYLSVYKDQTSKPLFLINLLFTHNKRKCVAVITL